MPEADASEHISTPRQGTSFPPKGTMPSVRVTCLRSQCAAEGPSVETPGSKTAHGAS